MTTLLSTTYFGPVQWYQKLCRSSQVFIEQYESFQKQTYRNRCVIATTSGPLALTVPVERDNSLNVEGGMLNENSSSTETNLTPHSTFNTPRNNLKSQIKDIRISDHGEWRHQHWNALVTAYSDSPFFDYYQDDLQPFFTERRWRYLLDFNMETCATVCQLIDIQPTVSLTESFQHEAPEGVADWREGIRPKHPAPDPDFSSRPYYQVYADRHGFLPNLSILDLLFNMGPEAVFYLISNDNNDNLNNY